MSYNDLSEYNYSAIDADGDAVAFFYTERQRDVFVQLINDHADCKNKQLTKGEYIDTDVTIQIRGS